MSRRLPLVWPAWAGSDSASPIVPWGSLVTIAGTPDSGKTHLASNLVQQALRRNRSVAWVSARRTADPYQVACGTSPHLHWVEGDNAGHPLLAPKVLASEAFDMVVIDSLDAYYTPQKPPAGQILSVHPGRIVEDIISAACQAKRGGRLVVVLNHLWEGETGEWMPGRDLLEANSSLLCRLKAGQPPSVHYDRTCYPERLLADVAKREVGYLPPAPEHFMFYLGLGIEGLG